MKKAKLQHETYGEIRIIISDGEIYLCAVDLAREMLGSRYNVSALYRCSKEKIKVQYSIYNSDPIYVFIPESEYVQCIINATAETQKRSSFLKWISNEIALLHNELSAKNIDIIQNPDIGIQLLSELKKEREAREKFETELKAEREKRVEAEVRIAEYKSKAKFTDNVMKLISDMREKAVV